MIIPDDLTTEELERAMFLTMSAADFIDLCYRYKPVLTGNEKLAKLCIKGIDQYLISAVDAITDKFKEQRKKILQPASDTPQSRLCWLIHIFNRSHDTSPLATQLTSLLPIFNEYGKVAQ